MDPGKILLHIIITIITINPECSLVQSQPSIFGRGSPTFSSYILAAAQGLKPTTSWPQSGFCKPRVKDEEVYLNSVYHANYLRNSWITSLDWQESWWGKFFSIDYVETSDVIFMSIN